MDGLPLETRPLPQPGLRWAGPEEGPPAGREERRRQPRGIGERRAVVGEGALWQEKLIGPNNLRPVSFLARGIALAKAVAHITLPGVGAGTGFLVGDDLLLTNGHVLPDEATAAEAIVRFNYEDTLAGRPKKVDTYRCRPGEGFHTSPFSEDGVTTAALDYSLVRLDRAAGTRWGRIVLAPCEVGVPQDVVIIQHPGGEKKQISITDNETAFADDLRCQYFTDTLPGSSGSPVFDDRWRLVALHHAGGFLTQPGDPTQHLRNEGVRIGPILADLPAWARTELAGGAGGGAGGRGGGV
jgi:V8-like Glu-specific endopeptidase